MTRCEQRGLAGELHLADTVYAEVLDQAIQMVEQRRRLSPQTLTLAG